MILALMLERSQSRARRRRPTGFRPSRHCWGTAAQGWRAASAAPERVSTRDRLGSGGRGGEGSGCGCCSSTCWCWRVWSRPGCEPGL